MARPASNIPHLTKANGHTKKNYKADKIRRTQRPPSHPSPSLLQFLPSPSRPRHLPPPPTKSRTLVSPSPSSDLPTATAVHSMRIRRSAARLLGSAYSTTSATPPLDMAPPTDHLPPPPPPLPHLALCSTTESRGGGSSSSPDATFGERCELNRSAWDLIAELSLSDPQVCTSTPHPSS